MPNISDVVMATDDQFLLCDTYYAHIVTMTPEQRYVLVAMKVLSCLLTVLTNGLAIYTIHRTKQLNNICIKLIMMLSIVDLLRGFQTVLTILVYGWYYKHTFCEMHITEEFLGNFFARLGVYIIALISFDRFARIYYLNRYPLIVTVRCIYTVCAMIVMVALGTSTAHAVENSRGDHKLVSMYIVATDLLVCIFMIIASLATICAVRVHRNNAQNRELLRSVDRRVTRLGGLVLATMLVLFIPYLIVEVVKAVYKGNSPKDVQWLQFIGYLGAALTAYNPAANALVFLCYNVKARRCIKRMWKKGGCAGRRNQDNNYSMSYESHEVVKDPLAASIL